MRWLVLLLLGCSTPDPDPKPEPPSEPSGLRGSMLATAIPGRPGIPRPSKPRAMACTIEATGAAGTVKITGDDTGNYQQQLAPGSYRLSISGCCEPAGRFEPEPPAMVELAAGVWQTLDLRCTIFGK